MIITDTNTGRNTNTNTVQQKVKAAIRFPESEDESDIFQPKIQIQTQRQIQIQCNKRWKLQVRMRVIYYNGFQYPIIDHLPWHPNITTVNTLATVRFGKSDFCPGNCASILYVLVWKLEFLGQISNKMLSQNQHVRFFGHIRIPLCGQHYWNVPIFKNVLRFAKEDVSVIWLIPKFTKYHHSKKSHIFNAKMSDIIVSNPMTLSELWQVQD